MPARFGRPIVLRRPGLPLELALAEVARQAGVGLSYGTDVTAAHRIVTADVDHLPAIDAFDRLLDGTPWTVYVSPSGQAIVAPRTAVAGEISGRVTAAGTGAGIRYATVFLEGTGYGTTTTDSGVYRIADVPAGAYTIVARLVGYLAVRKPVTVATEKAAVVDFVLQPALTRLEQMTITAQRLGESKAVALEKQRAADNLVTVLSGDEIRALPNANAAEGAARIPGVSTERDEGEGKFIQVRGTEPRLSNVTIDGAHVPGTQFGSRIPKVDAIPSDILAAIEVSKTLTADMDADAIGGSVNFVTKTPEGAPRGYVSAQAGQTTLLSHRQWQGGISYGGRFGADRRLGFLLGTSLDHNNRVISDVEPGWAIDGAGVVFPTEWSQREFLQNRSRFGVGGDLDYRYGTSSTVFVRGLFSEFHNFGYRYQYDVSFSADSAVSGTRGFGTGAGLFREVQNRTPRERLFGFTAGGRNERGPLAFEYSLNWAGTRQSARDYRFNPFNCTDPTCPTTLSYNASSRITPTYQYLTAADAAAAVMPSNYALTGYKTFDSFTSGRDLGAGANLLWRYDWGDHPGGLKFGVKVRDEFNKYNQNRYKYSTSAMLPLPQALGGFTDPNYYSNVTSAYHLGPLPDNGPTTGFVDSHQFTATAADSQANAAASFNGTERILAGYAMNTIDIGAWRINVGLRLENTNSSYTGHAVATPVAGPPTITTVPGSQTYTDLFPSLQLRWTVDPQTNLRFAVTRGIARPNYSDLAPSLVGSIDAAQKGNFKNLSAGNPNLRPQHAWNYDLLGERFIGIGGVISAGVFYKSITDFIYTRQFIYQGPVTAFQGFGGMEPQNGGSAHLLGFEADVTQHLTFLPGALAGIGFDVNWTRVASRANLLGTAAAGAATRPADVPRQAPNLANVALTYDYGHVSARAAWQYQGASITSYGDGSPTPNGDTYFSPHSQIDASVIYNVTPALQVQLQGLDLNDAYFGFFTGTPNFNYNIQREYYGRSFILGAKYSL